jgi:hypothetical protein
MEREQGEPVIESTELDPNTGTVEKRTKDPAKLSENPEDWREQK